MTRQQAEKQLQKLFGLRQFHDLQWQVIENLLAGRRVLLLRKPVLVNHFAFSLLLPS